MGPGGAITLNLLAIDKIFDYFEIADEDRLDLYTQVQDLASECLAAQERESERQRKQAESKKARS